MPAVIGLVFVFLVGVVIWVIATSGDDGAASEDGDVPTVTSSAPGASPTSPSEVTPPPSVSPTPLPDTVPATVAPPSSAPSSSPPTTVPAPVTTAPGATDGAVPGDLAVPGRPMQRPPCDGSYITVLASPIGSQATSAGIAAVLEQYPGSNYLRTDQTCRSLTPSADGAPIYVIFYGPFAFDSDACTARADGPEGAYARQLSDDVGPDHVVICT